MKKNLDVLLINPPSRKGKIGRGHFFTPPTGLGYLASYLKTKGFSTDIIDCDPENLFVDYFYPTKHQKEKLANFLNLYKSPILIGVGPCNTPFLHNTLALSILIKNIFKNSFLVIGGPHPSLSPPEMAIKMLDNFKYIDAICINEGENAIFELASNLKNGDNLMNIKGLVLRSKNGYIYNERKLMSPYELNNLPYPCKDLINKYSKKYKLAIRRNFFRILSNKILVKKYGKNPGFVVIFSSRGCPYRCTFCCSLSKRRVRSAESVVKEMEYYINKYNIYCFVFYDDLFTTSSLHEIKRIEEICKLIIKKCLKIFWEVELRADVICKLGRNILSLMNRAGCCTINIGIEKATDEALKWLKKDLKIIQIRNAIRIIRESGDFIINGTFILGGLNEKESDILNIISFSKDIDLDYAAYYPLEIHPGTEIFNIAKRYKIITDMFSPYIINYDNYPLFTNSKLSTEKLLELQCKAYRDFYFNVNHIKSLINKVNSVSTIYKQYEHFFEHSFLKQIR